MALFNQRALLFRPLNANGGGNTNLTFAVDASTDKWAASFVAPKAINLASVAVYIHSVTGTHVAYSVRIESDNGVGRPSGTLAWTNASATIGSGTLSAGWTSEIALTAAGDLVVGTIYHIVLEPDSDPAGANYITLRENGQFVGANFANLTCYASRNTGSWSAGSGAPVFVAVSSDGTPIRFGQVYHSGTVLTPTNTAWKGNKFVAPATMTVWGCGCGQLNSTSSGAVRAFLIDNSNTIVASGSIAAGAFDVLTARSFDKIFVFDTPYEITAGQTYRCVWSDPAGQWRFDYAECVSGYKDLRAAPDAMLTEGTSSDGSASPTSWTDTDTREVHDFTLLASEADSGGGGGGGTVVMPGRGFGYNGMAVH